MKFDLDITHLYKTFEDWEKEYKKYIESIELLKSKKNLIMKTANNFYNYMTLLLETDNLADKLFCYCKRQVDINFTLEELKQKMNDVLKHYGELEVLKNEFDKIVIKNEDKIKGFIKEERFKDYLRYINLILRKANHYISEENEEELSEYTSNLYKFRNNYQDILVNQCKSVTITVDGEEIEITRQNINELMKDLNEEHRILYAKNYVETYNEHNDKVAKILIDKLKNDMNLANIRKFDSLLSLKMFDYELNNSIFENLIKKVNENLNIKHQYNKLRAKILGLNNMHSYDTALPLVPNFDIKIDIEEAIKIIKCSLNVFGKNI